MSHAKRRETLLKKEAIRRATWRGHTFGNIWDAGVGGYVRPWMETTVVGETRQSTKCTKCGMHTLIDLNPSENETDISGQAVKMYCSGREE